MVCAGGKIFFPCPPVLEWYQLVDIGLAIDNTLVFHRYAPIHIGGLMFIAVLHFNSIHARRASGLQARAGRSAIHPWRFRLHCFILECQHTFLLLFTSRILIIGTTRTRDPQWNNISRRLPVTHSGKSVSLLQARRSRRRPLPWIFPRKLLQASANSRWFSGRAAKPVCRLHPASSRKPPTYRYSATAPDRSISAAVMPLRSTTAVPPRRRLRKAGEGRPVCGLSSPGRHRNN